MVCLVIKVSGCYHLVMLILKILNENDLEAETACGSMEDAHKSDDLTNDFSSAGTITFFTAFHCNHV